MNILVVCQHYYPENFQITDICEGLVKRGHNVTALVGLPNYPSGYVPKEYKHNRRHYEQINGVNIVRCNEIGRRHNPFYLMLNYLSFYISSMHYIRKIKGDFDCVFSYQLSPVTMGLSARYYAKKHNIPLYLYCCDLWPESAKMYIKNENNPIFFVAKKISSRVYNSCNKISVQSKTFIDYFKSVHGIEENKMIYIPAFADDKYLQKDYILDNGIIDFVFLGNIGIAQNLDLIIEAVKKIKHLNFRLHIVGDGTTLNSIKQLVAKNNLTDKVIFYGRRPVEEMEEFYKLADACIVSLNADNKTGLTLPAKVQGYMAAGKPIIGMINGAAQDVIRESKCGVCVNAGDVVGLSEIMKDFIINPDKYKDCGNNGRQYFKENFKKDKVIEMIEATIKELI